MDGIYIGSNGQYVLTNVPTPPPGFRNLTEPFALGTYLNGHDAFNVSDFRIVNIFHRQVGPADELLLGMLSVFLIAVLSELVQTILLRTGRDRRVFANNLLYAALVDEVGHFRNIVSHLNILQNARERARSRPHERNILRSRAFVSAVFLSIALLLFVAEVVAVLVTQPLTINSTKDQYNVQGIQPLGTPMGVSKFVLRRILENVCVTPIMRPLRQNRNFLVRSCFIVREEIALSSPEDLSDTIIVKSWFHSAGSDHNITFGPGSTNISIRSEIFTNTGINDISRRITYRLIDNSEMEHAKYIHRRLIHATIEWSCNQNFSKFTCFQLVDELKGNTRTETREILKWQGRNGPVLENVTGLVSTFEIRINSPYWAVRAGMRDLVTSGGIEETRGPATYHVIKDDSTEVGIAGLLSEEGRVAGLFPISLILLASFCVLIILRWFLKPISLTFMAMSQVNGEWANEEEGGNSAEYRWPNPYGTGNFAEYDLPRVESQSSWGSRDQNR